MPAEKYDMNDAQYWQRASTSESTYMRGPKAQQILNRDIAHCVSTLRELERLGQIKRGAIPLNADGGFMDAAKMDMENLDLPERDAALFVEKQNYQDFYGCMLDSGWERTEFVPYARTREAQDIYLRNYAHKEERVKRRKEYDPPYAPNEKD